MPDTTPPVLTGLSFPATVSTAGGAQSITFTVSGTDNASGIWSAIIWFSGVLVDGHNFIAVEGTYDSWADGTSTESGIVRADVPPGIYTIDRIELTDGLPNFNDAVYTTADLIALGFPTQITVVDTDTVAPQLLTLTFPTQIDVTAASQPATFAATGSDDATGIDEIIINFDKSLLTGPGAPGQIVIDDRLADPWSDGASALTATLPQGLPTGTYSITDVQVRDKAGNTRTYTPAELAALGIATSIEVTGGAPADTTPPVLDSLTFPTAIGPGSAPITIDAQATDPGGIDDLTIWLNRNITLSTGVAGGFLLDGTGNSWSDGKSGGTWSVSASTAPGIYEIDHVDVRDVFGNSVAYTATQLAALGLRTAFFVLDASFNVAANDVIGGTLGDDTLQGTPVNNVLFGLAGNDTLICGGGNDWMYGGPGDDTYRVKSTGDRVIEAAGEGIDRVFASVSFTLTINQEVEFLATTDAAATVAISLTGNAFANTITGNAGINVLIGGGDDDSLSGLGGDDSLAGGPGDDTMAGGAGIDTLDFSISVGPITVNLTLTGAQNTGEGLDTISGIENIVGSAFADIFTGQNLSNRFDGGAGGDSLYGGSGGDTLNGDAGADLIIGDAGNDTIDGGSEIDRLYGGSGDDTLLGGPGADALAGGPGVDRLDGGDGADRLFADTTADTFVFSSLAGAGDRVFNFRPGVHTLEVDAAGFGGTAGAFVFVSNANPNPTNATQAFLYDTDNGKLFFDADGTGVGARVYVGQIFAPGGGVPALLATDIDLL